MDLLEVAHHEAAHAVFHLKLGLRQRRVTIKPNRRRGTLGQAEIRRPKWINEQPSTEQEQRRQRIQAESEILALYAGQIAQAKYTGNEINWGHDSDDGQIQDLAIGFVSKHDNVRYPFLVYCRMLSARLVEAWWPEIQAVARALLERTTLTVKETREVIASIPDDVRHEHRQRLSEAFEREQERGLAEYWKQHPDEAKVFAEYRKQHPDEANGSTE
jgi:hypothetical protein